VIYASLSTRLPIILPSTSSYCRIAFGTFIDKRRANANSLASMRTLIKKEEYGDILPYLALNVGIRIPLMYGTFPGHVNSTANAEASHDWTPRRFTQ
jgi:hypothetical protein